MGRVAAGDVNRVAVDALGYALALDPAAQLALLVARQVALVLAALNELVWRTQSTEAWVWFKTFGLTAALFAFFMTQGKLFQEHGIEKKEDGGA